ncbi:HAMP domain-containing methyl-accepting chemotaxis protein [Sphingomonas hengshuiensis]|uniref:Chemotaxis protein n=1 Tax=Sphingomonas hengshuiensis TaxID=1609977 RepID=A0A7U5BFR0_9SPHN|nr:methyl-accepting chemotaxis protein [Sphingomonas hengshuiensis]AJP74400.1 chemotaxis protein [Sphingomonas hengshuiensis]
MQILSNLKISVKILLLLAMLGIAMIGVGIYGMKTIGGIDNNYSTLTDVKLPDTIQIARANRKTVEMVYSGYQALVYDGASREGQEAVENEAKAYDAAVTILSDLRKAEPEEATRIDDLRARIDALHKLTGEAVKLGSQNRNDEARADLAKADVAMKEFSKAGVAYADERIAAGKKLSGELSAASAQAGMMMIGVSLAALAAAMGVAAWVAQAQISKPIARLQDSMRTLADGNSDLDIPGTDRGDEIGGMAHSVLVFRDAARELKRVEAAKAVADGEQKLALDTLEAQLSQLADGDLSASISINLAPEYAGLKTNFNSAVAALRDLIGAVKDSAEAISTGAREIASASEDLARRTEGSAASLEETSAAVTQMATRLKSTAQASTQTVERANGAIAVVDSGRSIADEAVQAMGRVSDSAKGIDSVIEGLDKIAFQTRVLAMNAAVEAGRAGEAGRGFAVVADLVSALAMRAEEEAGRARDQLTATQTDIVAAVDMVRRVDTALGDIVGDVNEVHALLETMARDNQVQSAAVTEVSTAVGAIDQTTQQNAAMVEETSAAARNLNTEVAALSERAGRFRTGHDAPAPVRRVAAPVSVMPKASSAGTVAAVKLGQHSDEWASF